MSRFFLLNQEGFSLREMFPEISNETARLDLNTMVKKR